MTLGPADGVGPLFGRHVDHVHVVIVALDRPVDHVFAVGQFSVSDHHLAGPHAMRLLRSDAKIVHAAAGKKRRIVPVGPRNRDVAAIILQYGDIGQVLHDAVGFGRGNYVLGISSGASLGVALVVLAGIGSSIGIAGAAWVGAAVVLLVITAVGQRIKDIMVILILGMMFSSGVGAVVQILQYLSKEESLKAFVIWTMGALGDVTSGQLLILVPSVFAGLLLAVLTIKPLNLLLFGEEYAVTMGLNIRRSRSLLFLSTTLLAGTITAFCGPIGFIGLAMPHVTRMLFQNSDHHVLLPGTILSGASILLLCDIISKIFTLPINAITALLGIPIVVWVVLRNKSITA